MELSNNIKAFETYYGTWEKNPMVKPTEYFKTPGAGGPAADAKKANKTIKALHNFMGEKKALIIQLGRLANRFGKLEPQSESQKYINEFKEFAKTLKGFSQDDISAVAGMIYHLNKHFDSSAFGATPAATEAFYEAVGTLLMFLAQKPLWEQ